MPLLDNFVFNAAVYNILIFFLVHILLQYLNLQTDVYKHMYIKISAKWKK